MRKRTQVGVVRIYDALIDRLSHDNEEVPSGWSGLVDDEDDQDAVEPPPSPGAATAPPYLGSQEVYFPLPANRRMKPKPSVVHIARDRSHVGGLALDGDLPGPRQRRPSPLAGLGERPSVLRHLLDGKGAQDGLRQHLRMKFRFWSLWRLPLLRSPCSLQ
jgi:hypothetical protein